MNNLLQKVSLIIQNQKNETLIKGESFNIFELLKVESKENNTHSNFIGELLNSHGSHLLGDAFLNLFLDLIGDKTLARKSTKVYLEKSIGAVAINEKTPLNSIGGRIDIYLEDAFGKSISIENKIYASDQKHQIIRYNNHNKGNNTVYYLNLDGHTPSEDSIKSLVEDKDFHILSYKNTIIDWLEQCHQKASDQPILRETIKQYLLLIKKLTGTMSDQNNEPLFKSILTDFEAANIIAVNLEEARQKICREIQNLVYDALCSFFSDKTQPREATTQGSAHKYAELLSTEKGEDVIHKHSQIFIRPTKIAIGDRALNFTLESFSGNGHYNGQLFIFILNPPPHNKPFALAADNRLTIAKWVINEKKFTSLEGFEFNLKNPATIQKLYTDAAFKAKFVSHIVKEVVDYIEIEFPNLDKYI